MNMQVVSVLKKQVNRKLLARWDDNSLYEQTERHTCCSQILSDSLKPPISFLYVLFISCDPPSFPVIATLCTHAHLLKARLALAQYWQ